MLIVLPFSLGFFSGFAALFFELIAFSLLGTISQPTFPLNQENFSLLGGGIGFLALSATIEEVWKFLVIRSQREASSFSKHPLLFSFIFGCGFGLFEILLASLTLAPSENMHAFIPLAGILILHVFTAIILGGWLFKYRYSAIPYQSAVIFLSVCIHLLYNFALLKIQ